MTAKREGHVLWGAILRRMQTRKKKKSLLVPNRTNNKSKYWYHHKSTCWIKEFKWSYWQKCKWGIRTGTEMTQTNESLTACLIMVMTQPEGDCTTCRSINWLATVFKVAQVFWTTFWLLSWDVFLQTTKLCRLGREEHSVSGPFQGLLIEVFISWP